MKFLERYRRDAILRMLVSLLALVFLFISRDVFIYYSAAVFAYILWRALDDLISFHFLR